MVETLLLTTGQKPARDAHVSSQRIAAPTCISPRTIVIRSTGHENRSLVWHYQSMAEAAKPSPLLNVSGLILCAVRFVER